MAHHRQPSWCRQSGAALLIFTLLLTLGLLSAFLSQVNSATQQSAWRNQITSDALAQAKEALIGYAASVAITAASRPGDLPCPDRDNDGKAGTSLATSCGSAAGSNQDRRLGRLPWKDLGLPDLRDDSEERLWYAVSNNYKNQTRTAILNSDTNGTITIRDASSAIVYDGSAGTGVVAVIIAPGAPLTRQDGLQQARTEANINDPEHYLDNLAASASTAAEDNANFDETLTLTNGFFAGPARDANGSLLANDRLLVITRDEIMAAVEKRVAQEALNCLTDYAADASNKGRLPWAADIALTAQALGTGGDFLDKTNTRFGRLPDTFDNTLTSSGAIPMKDHWTTACNINIGSWWSNWRELVFYAVADAHKPQQAVLPSCGSCLTVSPPAAAADKRFAIFMAKRRLATVAGGQPRATVADKSTIANYLEDQNATPADDIFAKSAYGPAFNDYVLFQ